jgi:hypothetical protein
MAGFRVGDKVKLVQRRDLYGDVMSATEHSEWQLDHPYTISLFRDREEWLGPDFSFQGDWTCVVFEELDGYWFRSDDLEFAAEPGTYCSLAGEKVYFVGIDPRSAELAVIIDHEGDLTRCYTHNFMPWREPPQTIEGYITVVRGTKTGKIFFMEEVTFSEKDAHEVFEREDDGTIELVEVIKINYEETEKNCLTF